MSFTRAKITNTFRYNLIKFNIAETQKFSKTNL